MERLLKLFLAFSCALSVSAATGSWNGVSFTGWNSVSVTAWNGTSIAASAAANTLTNGLISYWTMNAASGGETDSEPTGTAHNLSDNNTVTAGTGLISGARQFTAASTEFLSVADHADYSGGAAVVLSFIFWVNMDAKGANRSIMSKYGSSGNREYNLRYLTSSDKFNWVVSADGIAQTVNLGANNFGSPSTGTWMMVYCYLDGPNGTAGVSVNNGTANTSSALTGGCFDSTAALQIGALTSGTTWDGRIDEVGIWNRVLTAGELTSLYNGGAGKTYPF